MTNIGSLVQFLLKKQPPENQARLALYHYLKNLKDLSDPLNRMIIQEFFLRSLGHQYWQDHRDLLAQSVLADLSEFQQTHNTGFDLHELLWPNKTQVIFIEDFDNFFSLLKKYVEREKEASTKYQMIKLPNNKVLVLLLESAGTLTCRVYGQLVYLRDGELTPLPPETHLHYNSRMELAEKTPQLLTSSLMTFCQFALIGDECAGVRLKGFTYQKEEVITGTLLQRPDLFYPIKSLERFFIKPESDPFYSELTRILEKANELLKTAHPDQEKIAQEAYKRGNMALKNIFPDDKLLHLLVSNLQHSLIQRGLAEGSSQSSPNQGGSTCRQISPLSRSGSTSL